MAGNEQIANILQRLLDSHEAQEQWVRSDSDFDPESSRIMLDLLEGQKACVLEFSNWIAGLECELPVSLTTEEGAPESWRIEWDDQPAPGMTTLDADMLDAMRYVLFNGDAYRPGNTVIDGLLGKGMPSRLRDDVENA